MHSEIVLPGGQTKDQHKQCKLAAIFVLPSSTCITHNAYFVTYICFYAEFIIQIPGKC